MRRSMVALLACTSACSFDSAGAAPPHPGSDGASDVLVADVMVDVQAVDRQPPDGACAQSCRTCSGCCHDGCVAGPPCTRSCSTADCTCWLDCDPGAQCSFACSGGASCVMVAGGASSMRPDCSGQASCDIDCRDLSVNCAVVKCSGQANCILRCGGNLNCAFDATCPAPQSCAAGIQVCRRSCP